MPSHDYFQQYHLNAAISHQHSAYLHANGAREYVRRGLYGTAALWQSLAALHAKCARIEMQRYYLQQTAQAWRDATKETGLMA